MATHGGSPARSGRSRAFAQPLLLTIAGVIGPIALLMARRALVSSESDPCTGLSCGWIDYGGIVRGVLAYVVWLLVTGLIVGVSSRDARLASRAILLAVAMLSLIGFLGALVSDTRASANYLRDLVLSVVGVAIALFVPIRLGFAVGRRAKGSGTSS